jgi:hypothetical protein
MPATMRGAQEAGAGGSLVVGTGALVVEGPALVVGTVVGTVVAEVERGVDVPVAGGAAAGGADEQAAATAVTAAARTAHPAVG